MKPGSDDIGQASRRMGERDKDECGAKLVALGAAVDEGDTSGLARGDVFRRVKSKLTRPE